MPQKVFDIQILADIFPQMSWVVDAEGNDEYLNRRFQEYLGKLPDGKGIDRWRDVIHPDDLQNLMNVWSRALQTGQFEAEYRLRCQHGEYRWHLGRAVPWADPAGSVWWCGTLTDIEDRKKAEIALKHTTELLKAVCDASVDGVFVKDINGKYLVCNPAAARFIGRPVDQILGMDDLALFDPESARILRESDTRILTNGVLETEEQTLTARGVTGTYLTTKGPYLDETGSTIGLIGYSRDVTESKRAEANLHLRDRAIRAVPLGILITDSSSPDNPVVYASPGFEHLTGYTASEAIGRNCRFLQGPQTDAKVVARVREAIREGKACTVDLLNYRKDGTTFWNELSISPVRNDANQLTHFVGVQTDVTERRSLEEQFRQAQKMEAVGRLAGGIAHDFNNILTVICGYSKMLLENVSPDNAMREAILEIDKVGRRAGELIGQLLAFSHQTVLEPRILDANELVRNAEKLLHRVIGEDISLSTHLTEDAGNILADATQLEQVLVNLCVNARDAMPEGGQLTIGTRNAKIEENRANAKPGSFVAISVTDTGHGMDEITKNRIFEPFFTTKEVGKGTGLGLAMVYGFVRQSGGFIHVESEPGLGARFEIFLPRTERVPTPIPAAMENDFPMLLGSETILLVEDDDSVRIYTASVLRGCGYEVMEAIDGNEACRLVENLSMRIDLLVTDVVMPGGIGGRKVAELTVAAHPEAKVLYISGYTDDALVRHGVTEASIAFLQKPFTPHTLAGKVREILDKTHN
jgi:PAS domain S-box-containing protein